MLNPGWDNGTMDANQPVHYPIHIYDESPMVDEGRTVTLCPRGRTLNRPTLGIRPDQVTCRRCGELLDVLGLRPER